MICNKGLGLDIFKQNLLGGSPSLSKVIRYSKSLVSVPRT